MRPCLSGEELELETHDSFKLARVIATGELKRPFAVDPDYAPPLLSVQAWPALEEEVAQIVAQLGAKIRVVAGRTTTIAIADLPRMWMRYTLARMTPLLRHLLASGATPPYALYTALVETAGALAAFSLQEPAELPPYKHDDPGPCVRALLAFLDDHLGEAVPDRFSELQLAFDGKK